MNNDDLEEQSEKDKLDFYPEDEYLDQPIRDPRIYRVTSSHSNQTKHEVECFMPRTDSGSRREIQENRNVKKLSTNELNQIYK